MSAAASPSRAARAARRRASGPWRWLTGEPGPGPALGLAVIALLGAFIAVAGPRQVTSLQNTALRQTLASAGQFGISASYSFQIPPFIPLPANAPPGTGPVTIHQGSGPSSGILPPSGIVPPPVDAAQVQHMGRVMGSYLRPPLISPPAQRWSGLTAPALSYPGAPKQAILGLPPVLEIAYRTPLAGHTRLVSGSLPQTAISVKRGGQSVIILQAAVTMATARLLGLRLGSQVALGYTTNIPGVPPLMLSVTGLIRPTDPGSSFWTADPSLAAPIRQTVGASTEWAGGVFVAASELAAVETGYIGANLLLSWEYPLVVSGLTASQVPGLLAAMTRLVSGGTGEKAVQAAGLPQGSVSFGSPPTLSAAGAGALSKFEADQAAVATIVSVLLAGILAALTILLLVGGVVVTSAYSGELTLGRARGGSTPQLALRILGTTAGVAGPALAAGTAAGIFAVPHSSNAVSWILLALVATAALAAPPLLAAWRHRGLWSVRAAGRGDVVTGRHQVRRLIAETTVLMVVAGAVLALRLRGLAPGSGFDPYLSSAPVLVAVAAGLIAVRLYPVPVRALLRVTRAGRGMVGYLAMARSGRSRLVPLLPALALIVALTVIALGGLVRAAVSSGQVTAAWQQVGADAVVQDRSPGGSIPAAARSALAAVPGVRLACAAYVIPPGTAASASLSGATGAVPVGVVIADPAQYGAAVADTPWPAFPARLLAPPRGAAAASGPVPVIASPAVVAAARSAVAQLGIAGSQLTIRVAATAASTPALPAGGRFVILPAWSVARLTYSVAPNTLLLMGAGINVAGLRAVAARVLPGGQVLSRAAVVQAAAGKPLVHASDLIFDEAAGTAAGCAVAAVLLGLLLSGRDRTRLATWLAAMGMTGRQGRRLAVLDTLPLLLVAIVGAEVASLTLGPLIGSSLVLSPLTGSAARVPLQPDLAALITPAAGAVILIMAAALGRNALTRRGAAGLLRLDESR
jgi:putative ABC transport system permease protein